MLDGPEDFLVALPELVLGDRARVLRFDFQLAALFILQLGLDLDDDFVARFIASGGGKRAAVILLVVMRIFEVKALGFEGFGHNLSDIETHLG